MIKNHKWSFSLSFIAVTAMNKHNGINWLSYLGVCDTPGLPPPKKRGIISTHLEIILLSELGLSLPKG